MSAVIHLNWSSLSFWVCCGIILLFIVCYCFAFSCNDITMAYLSFIFCLFSPLFMAVVTHSCFFPFFHSLSLFLSLSLWAKLLCRALSRLFSHNTSSYQVLLSPSGHWCEVAAFTQEHTKHKPFLTVILYTRANLDAHREEKRTLT